MENNAVLRVYAHMFRCGPLQQTMNHTCGVCGVVHMEIVQVTAKVFQQFLVLWSVYKCEEKLLKPNQILNQFGLPVVPAAVSSALLLVSTHEQPHRWRVLWKFGNPLEARVCISARQMTLWWTFYVSVDHLNHNLMRCHLTSRHHLCI